LDLSRSACGDDETPAAMRTYEEQLNTASSLNLLLAAIVVWNTVHLQVRITFSADLVSPGSGAGEATNQ
jgi:Tn3 transposase DDE domain